MSRHAACPLCHTLIVDNRCLAGCRPEPVKRPVVEVELPSDLELITARHIRNELTERVSMGDCWLR